MAHCARRRTLSRFCLSVTVAKGILLVAVCRALHEDQWLPLNLCVKYTNDHTQTGHRLPALMGHMHIRSGA